MTSGSAKRAQTSLFASWQKDRFAFGGSKLGRAHARGKRPFSRKLAVHVVLRSSQAMGARSLLRQGRLVDVALFEEASKQRVTVHGAANAGNHMHLLVQAPSRNHLSAFLRAVSGRIAMIATGARKGAPLKNQSPALRQVGARLAGRTRFWDQRPFTRLVSLGNDFTSVLAYISLNSTEMAGFTRLQIRQMFAEIRERLRRGELTRSPELRAAGFV